MTSANNENDASAGLVDSQGRPLRSAQSGPESDPSFHRRDPNHGGNRRRNWFVGGSILGALTAAISAGTLLLEYQTRQAERETTEVALLSAEEAQDAAAAERTPPIEVTYWIGARADELLASTDPDSLLPEQFAGIPIVESPGDWLAPSTLPIARADIQCESSACEEMTDEDIEPQLRTLWLLVTNNSDETLGGVAVDWHEKQTEPIDLDGPFEALRATTDVESTSTEQLVDLEPGGALMIPAGTAIRINALGAIRAVPVGGARIPLSLTFMLAGEDERRQVPVREPAQTVVSEGYDTSAGERVGVGG